MSVARGIWRIAESTVLAAWDDARPVPGRWLAAMASHSELADSAHRVDVQLELAAASAPVRPDHDVLVEVDETGAGERRIRVRHALVSGEIRGGEGSYRGRFELFQPDEDTICPDVAVRTALSLRCEDRGELLLHASALERNGEVWIFAGRGGAGKTTIAETLAGGGTPFAVDRVVIAFDDGGAPIAHSTPFSDRNRVLNGRRSGPIAAICFIEHAARHGVRRMSPFEATVALFKETLAFSRDLGHVDRTLGAVGRIAETGLCLRLLFARNDGFWPLIQSARRPR